MVMSRDDSLHALPNLGRASERMLARAGIVSAGALRRIGSVEAFLRVEEAGGRPSLNLLYALESALGNRGRSARRGGGAAARGTGCVSPAPGTPASVANT